MASVNIDKLIKMSAEEERCFDALAENILEACNGDKISIGVTGVGVSAFKLAASIMNTGKKVVFIDADLNENIFISKYKLGKNLKGVTDYFTGGCEAGALLCNTNRPDLKIIFTGETDSFSSSDATPEQFEKLFKECFDEYDVVVVQADDDGYTARACDKTIAFLRDEDYTDKLAENITQTLTENGCDLLGIVIDECN